MLKHLQKLLLIGAMLCVPWVTQAQSISDYTFSTGTDNTAWVTLSSSATEVTTIYDDDEGSAVMNIGFTFQFCGINYTQWSCNSNGRVCLGSTAVDGWWVNPFIATNLANTRNVFPLISAFGMDNTLEGTGVWCKYEVVGTAPNRMLVIEYRTPSEYDADGDLVNYQIQLEEGTNIVRFVYGTTAASTYDDFQIGLAYSATEVATVYGDTVHYGATNTTLNSWPGVNRYYEFTSPVVTCPRPTALSLSDITSSGATFSWMAGGTETTWLVSDGTTWYSTTDTFYTFTTLSAMTDYTLSVRALCSASDTSSANTIALRTACGAITDLPFVENFESYAASSTATIPCWTKGTNSTTAYPYPSSTVVNGTRCLYFYGYHPSSTTSTPIYSWAALPPIDDNLDMSDLQLNLLVKRYSSATNYYTSLLYIGIADSVNGLTSASAIESTVTWVDTIDLFSAAASSIHSEEVSFADYAGTGKYVVIYCPVPPLQGSSTYAYNYAYVDDVTLRTIPTCFWPTEVELANVAPNEAVISWTPDSRTANPTAWNVEYGEHGFTLGQGITTTVTDTSITLSNLLANTQYDIYVSADCGNGDVSDPAMLAFRTQCSWLDEMPYSEGFESSTTGGTTSTNFVECMTRLNNGTQYFGYPYVSSSTTYVHSGTKGLYWYHTTTTGTYGDYEVVVLPGIDTTAIDMTDLVLSFYAKTTGSSYHPTPIVGVMTNPNDINTFTPVYTFTNTEITTDWNIFSVPFTNYTGYGNYVAIRWNRPTSASYMCIDDIYLTDEWCDNPTDVTASAGVDEVTISWNSNGGTSFEVILGADTAINVTDTFYTFSNLNANTLYTYSVATECSNGNSVYINGSIRTLCADLDSLPYSYGFEGLATTSSSAHPVIPCWQHLNNASTYFGYPYVSSTTPHAGTRNLYWYGSTTTGTYGDYQIVALPGVDTNQYPINTLQLKFWARSTGTSYNVVFQVGVMTDPQDASTFTQVGTVNVGGNTTWAEYTTQLSNYQGYGRFVAVRALRPTSTWYAYTDDFTLEEIPSCPVITDLDVAAVTVGSAMLTWSYMAGTEDTPIAYEIEYVNDSTGNSVTATATDAYYVLTGLDAATPYTFYVRADCGNGYGAWDSIVFTTESLGCLDLTEVQFTNSTSGVSGCLAYSSWGNTVYQALYTAAELTAAGMTAGPIRSIDLGFTSSTYNKEFTIFIDSTTTTSISDANIEAPTAANQVYGPAAHPSGTSGWQHYEFTTPFVWDGTSNIIITTFMNQPTGQSQTSSSGLTGYYVSASNKARYRYKDSSPFTLTTLTSGSAGSTYSYRASIHFYQGDCQIIPSCAEPAVSVTDYASDRVDIAWIPGYQETSWDLDYRVGNGAWQNELTGTSLTSYSFTNLTPATDYEFRVSHTCDTTTYASTVEITTPCVAMPVPFDEDFEEWSTTSTYVASCWAKYSPYGSGYPYISTSQHHSGTKSMYMYSYTYSNYLYLALPMLEPSIDSLQVSFWLYKSSSSYATSSVRVGVMTDPDDHSTFVPVGSATPVYGNGWTMYDINMNSYTGNGKYIAFECPVNTSVSYPYIYLDDIHVDYIPTCPHVTNLHSTRVTEDSVYLAWTAGGSETEWVVSDGENEYSTTTPSYAFDQLHPNVAYTFTVRPVCSTDDTGFVMDITVRTECPAYMSLPFTENFDGYTTSTTAATGFEVPCWNYTMTSSSYSSASYHPQVYYTTSSNYHHSGLYSLRLYGESYFVLPQSPIGIDSLSMSFWSMHSSTSYNLIVGVMSDPTDITTFDTIMTVPYTATSVMQHFEIDFSNYDTLPGIDTMRYIAFRNWYTSYGYSYHYIDDIEVWRNSSCASPSFVMSSNVSNNVATISWSDTSNTWAGTTLYWGRYNDFALAEDSITLPAGTMTHTLTGLTGSTTYYVWVQGECAIEPSRAAQVSFTTGVDCAPVNDLHVVASDYHAFGLNWSAPTTGFAATSYIVSWKANSASSWNSDTTTNLYYHVNGLDTNTTYQYRVTTICDTLVSAENSGTVQTQGCGHLITNGGTTTSYLPTYPTYNYSYTQQIYLAEELNDIDSITSVSFYNAGNVQSRSVILYMANTSKSSFSGTGDYLPFANLTQVGTATLNGTGWLRVNLTTPFAREADSNLVIAMDDNTGSWVSAGSWTATSTSAVRGIYFYQDAADILPASPSASSSASVSYVNQIKVTTTECEIPTCDVPVVFIDSVGEHDVTIAWNTENSTSYEVAYKQADDASWTIAETANTTGSSIITGLSAAANYTFRVRFDCNGDTLVGTNSTWTACGAVNVPVYENFESHASGVFSRPCWTIGSTNLGTSYPQPYVISLTGDPNKLCLFYSGGYMILPQMNAPLNELQARFTLVQGGDSVRFLIGLMDDPNMPISTMTVLDTLIRSDYDTTSSTVQITYSFANIAMSDTSKHIAFWDAFSDNYSFIDNLVIEYIPSCTPVTDLTVSNVGTTTAEVSWLDAGTNSTGYILEYGPRGFTPGQGTTVAAATSPMTLTGLDHSTNYELYVYTECAALGDTSIGTGPAQFTTNCDALTTLPYVMNFENIMPAGTGSSNTSYRPNCWNVESAGTVPHIYYTTSTQYAPSQAYAFRVVSDGYVVMNEMGVSLDSLMISFHDYNFTPGTYGIVVGAVDDNTTGFGSTFVPIDTIPFVAGTNEYDVVSFLGDYTGTSHYIAMKFYGNTGTGTAHYIDNLTIDRAPNCIAPQRVHTTLLTNIAADLAWSFSNASSYTVEYGVHGFTPGAGTTLTTTTRSASLTNLTPFTQYDVYLVSGCGSDTTFYTFTTLRAAPVTQYPYICDFSVADERNAWEPVNGTAANAWTVGTAAHYGTGDNYSMYISNDNGTTNAYTSTTAAPAVYTYRTFTMAAGSYNIGFNWQAYGESNYDYLRAYLVPVDIQLNAGVTPIGGTSSYSNASAAPSAGWIALGSKLNLQSSWQSFSEDVTITTAGNYNLVFYWGNDGSVGTNPPAAVDNIEVYINTCPAPIDLYSAGSGQTSINLDWTDVETPQSWIVEYGPTGYTHGSSAATSIAATSHPVLITGLDSLTNYDFYVRSICTGDDTGRWSRPVTLMTNICDNGGTFVNYTSDMTSTTSSYYGMGYTYYPNTYNQTIIDSAYLANVNGDVSALAFYANTTGGGAYMHNVSIWMANVPEANLASGWIMPDANHVFVQVLDSADLTFNTTGMHIVEFDSVFTWDGHSNVLLAIIRANGTTSTGSSYTAPCHYVSGSSTMTRYSYSTTVHYNINTTPGGTTSTSTYHGDFMFFTCGGAACPAPNLLTPTNVDYQSATLNWTGNATDYEVAVKAATDPAYPAATAVSATTFPVNNLLPATTYLYHVRALCDTAEGLISDWVEGTFTTDSLPCFAPTALHVVDSSYTNVTLGWTVGTSETSWNVHVWNTNFDTMYTVTNNPATVGGLATNMSYNAAVSALCGGGLVESDYSDTISFMTAMCQVPTGVTATNITTNAATITWNGTASSYELQYGPHGFPEGQGTVVTVNGTTYNMTGLESETDYDVAVSAVCDAGNGVQSTYTARYSFTTAEEIGISSVNGLNVTIYPNPTSTTTNITLSGVTGDVTISVIDMNGRTVRSSTMSCDGDCATTIEVSDLASGAYFVRISGEEVNTVKKLVVK